MSWSTGVAPIIGTTGCTIRVQCPHCGQRHTHGRNMAGSRHILAGCHTGHTRCREYAIPAPPAQTTHTGPDGATWTITGHPAGGRGVKIAAPASQATRRGSLPSTRSGFEHFLGGQGGR